MDISFTRITESAEETQALGREVAHSLISGMGESAQVLCLYGDLGSGKTTFSQGVAKELGIQTRLLSPTFIIVRRYEIADERFLYHVDLYRLNNEDELAALGFSEILADPNAIIIIEWAEKLDTLLPKKRIDVRFKTLEDDKHEITIEHR